MHDLGVGASLPHSRYARKRAHALIYCRVTQDPFGTHEWYPRMLMVYVAHPENNKTPGNPGVLSEADEGIRTLDLRHGKATL
jgi:hypothetical protein